MATRAADRRAWPTRVHPSLPKMTPLTSCNSCSSDSFSSRMNDHAGSRSDSADSESDDVSITLEEIMSESEDTTMQVLVNSFGSKMSYQSSLTCLGSFSSSKDTLPTASEVAISPHELAKRKLKEQQREARRTQAAKLPIEMTSLEDYFQMTRPSKSANFIESNVAAGFERSRSERSLTTRDATTSNGLPRSNSFSERSSFVGSSLMTATSPHCHQLSSSFSEHSTLLSLNNLISELDDSLQRLELFPRLEEDDDESSIYPNLKRERTASLALKECCDFMDGYHDEDSYMRHARGRHQKRQHSLRDVTKDKTERDKKLRQEKLHHKEPSAHDHKQRDKSPRACDLELQRSVSGRKVDDKHVRRGGRHKASKVRSRHTERRKSERQSRRSRKRRSTKSKKEPLPSKHCSNRDSTRSDSSGSSTTSDEGSDDSVLSGSSLSPPSRSSLSTPDQRRPTNASDEEDAYSSTEEECSDSEDGDNLSECDHEPSVVVQFDAKRAGHVYRIRPDMESASWLEIKANNELMEGHIFKMPTPDVREASKPPTESGRPGIGRATSDPTQRAKLSHSPSVLGFFFRRPKSAGRNEEKHQVEDNESASFADDSIGVYGMESKAHFDELGRSGFSHRSA